MYILYVKDEKFNKFENLKIVDYRHAPLSDDKQLGRLREFGNKCSLTALNLTGTPQLISPDGRTETTNALSRYERINDHIKFRLRRIANNALYSLRYTARRPLFLLLFTPRKNFGDSTRNKGHGVSRLYDF